MALSRTVSREPDDDPWSKGAAERRAGIDILSLVPLAAIVALVVLVLAMVWVVSRTEADQVRTKLATDALWVEQTLRFQLSVDEDMLVRLALDEAGGIGADALEARARVHIASNPEVLAIAWYNAAGRPIQAVPGFGADTDGALVDRILKSDRASSRPSYGEIRDRTVTMAMRVGDGDGVVTAAISLPLVLERHIPWWIAEQYGVALTDSGGTVLASRARRTPSAEEQAHAISFDPPLPGTILRITPFDKPPLFVNALLVGSIAALALFAILALLALHRNAQRRRRAEQRLVGEMAFRRSMEESLTVGLRAKDHDGRILYVNSAFCKLVGWPAEDLVGRTAPMPYWAPDRLEETLDRQRALARGGAVSQSFETRFKRIDSAEIDVQVFEAPLIDATGRHRGWMGSVIDITETKRAARDARAQEDSMARTGRLVTLGEMASTLAHELNQPLSAIASYAAGARNLLDAGKADSALLAPAIEKLALQASRAGQIIRRIQDFVKKREPRFDDVDLRSIITETIGFLAADARDNRIDIITELDAVDGIRADRILLEQLLVNLIRNGIEAMADDRRRGDAITVRLLAAPDTATIEVEDQGPGIAADVADRLFDAFSSTKAQGMGMGLNICRSIVEMHRGKLSYRSSTSGGTVFVVTLPRSVIEEEAAAAQ